MGTKDIFNNTFFKSTGDDLSFGEDNDDLININSKSNFMNNINIQDDTIYIKPSENIDGDGKIITSLLSQYNKVVLSKGTYIIKSGYPIRIINNYKSLIGTKGALIKLDNNQYEPCIYIGTKSSSAISDINIEHLEIDGNKTGNISISDTTLREQSGTLTSPVIKNNGIIAHNVNNLSIINCIIKNTLSGGIILGDPCNKVVIANCSSSNNIYDGIGADGNHTDIVINNCTVFDNETAGFTFDTGITGPILINNCTIRNNLVEGIFIRNAQDISVTNCSIKNNGDKGIALYKVNNTNYPKNIKISDTTFRSNVDEAITASYVKKMDISSCTFIDNGTSGTTFNLKLEDACENVILNGCNFNTKGIYIADGSKNVSINSSYFTNQTQDKSINIQGKLNGNQTTSTEGIIINGCQFDGTFQTACIDINNFAWDNLYDIYVQNCIFRSESTNAIGIKIKDIEPSNSNNISFTDNTFILQGSGSQSFNTNNIDKDLMLFSNNKTKEIVTFDNNKVGIGTDNPIVPMHIRVDDTSNNVDASDSAGRFDDYHLIMNKIGGTSTGSEIGLGFDIQGNAEATNTRSPGASITHERTGSYSKGKIHFKTKTTTGASDYLTTAMTINDNSNVGIGTTNPEALLHISSGTTGSCELILEADTDNNNESDNARILFRQDGGYIWSMIGASPSTDNELILANSAGLNSGGIVFKTANLYTSGVDRAYENATEVMRIHSNQNVGIGTDNPTEKLEVNGNILANNVINIKNNLMDTDIWSTQNAGSIGTNFGNYSLNQSTSGENNMLVNELGPFGDYEHIWKCISDSDNDNDGGWNYDINNVNHKFGYLSIVYFKITNNSSGKIYHGCKHNDTLNLDGSINTNPYFVGGQLITSSGNFNLNQWYLSIGVLLPYKSGGYTSPITIGGIYNVSTGEKILSNTNFMMKENVTIQKHRAYLFYSTSTGAELNFARPAFYKINGTEPSLSELLGGSNHNTVTSTDFNYTYSSFSGAGNKWQNIASINLTPGKWLIMTHFASYANYSSTSSQIRNSICFRENSSEASGSASNLSGVIALQADIDNRNSDFILKRHNLYTVYTTTTNQTIYLSIEVASGYTLRVMGYENVTSALGSSRNDHKSEFFAIQL